MNCAGSACLTRYVEALVKVLVQLTYLLVYAKIRLQQYIIMCCQFAEGGLRDKPSKPRDQYHTCYSLSGMSLSQHHG